MTPKTFFCSYCGEINHVTFELGEPLTLTFPKPAGFPLIPEPGKQRIIQIIPFGVGFVCMHNQKFCWIRNDVWAFLLYGIQEITEYAPDFLLMDFCTESGDFASHPQHEGHTRIDGRYPDDNDDYRQFGGYQPQNLVNIDWKSMFDMMDGVAEFLEHVNRQSGKTRFSHKFLIWEGWRNKLLYNREIRPSWQYIDWTTGEGSMGHKDHWDFGVSGL